MTAKLSTMTRREESIANLAAAAEKKYTALYAARALLDRIDNITAADFEKGGERTEREALRKALKDCGL